MSVFLFFRIGLSIIFDMLLVFSMNISVLLINYPFIVLMTFTNIDIIKIHILSMFSNFQFTLLYRHYFIFLNFIKLFISGKYTGNILDMKTSI